MIPTPADVLVALACVLLALMLICHACLILWLIWREIVNQWRAWRGRDPDDKEHA